MRERERGMRQRGDRAQESGQITAVLIFYSTSLCNSDNHLPVIPKWSINPIGQPFM